MIRDPRSRVVSRSDWRIPHIASVDLRSASVQGLRADQNSRVCSRVGKTRASSEDRRRSFKRWLTAGHVSSDWRTRVLAAGSRRDNGQMIKRVAAFLGKTIGSCAAALQAFSDKLQECLDEVGHGLFSAARTKPSRAGCFGGEAKRNGFGGLAHY